MAKTNWFRHKPVDIREFIEIARDETMRISSTPFGAPPGVDRLVGGSAVPWKHNPEKMPRKVKEGLAKAIDISKKARETYGTILWHGKYYPKKAIMQKVIAGKISKEELEEE